MTRAKPAIPSLNKNRKISHRKTVVCFLFYDSIYAIIKMKNKLFDLEYTKMYTIEFYEKADGKSELWEFLEALRMKAATNKDSRVQYKQAIFCIQLLQDNGTHLPNNITKHLDDGIWELRPGNNRIFYFFYQNDTFVLLHSFRKRSQKTPRCEIEKAKAERDNYLSRKGTDNA